jgi:hypothetical protein
MLNPVQRQTGAAGFGKPLNIAIVLGLAVVFGIVIAKKGFVFAIILSMAPFLIYLVNRIFHTPKLAVFVVVFMGFIAIGISRYVKGPPYGLSIDGLLVLGYLGLFFKNFYEKIDWSHAGKGVTYAALIWYGYAVFQLVNPEAISREAWFYSMRGVALYPLLMAPLILMLMRDYRDLNTFLKIWCIMSLLATFKGFIQANIGVDPWEQAWLDGGGEITHILFGKLRVFSFYSDAGQFGAAQAHLGVVAGIIFMTATERKDKIFYGFVSLASFYGMLISGTRGAIAVPFTGFFLFLILIRNVKLVTLGTIMGIIVFVFFKYTLILNNVDQIRRMRTAFDPNDKSLQVRLENQKRLKTYLATRPFGGGMGHAGDKAQRFTPNAFLANVATDSWYVMIWAEMGVVGLVLHLGILFYVLIHGSYIAMFRVRDPALQGKFFGLAGGMFGIMAAAYGNGVLGQLPTSTVLYASMAFLFIGEEISQSYDKHLEEKGLLNKENQ